MANIISKQVAINTATYTEVSAVDKLDDILIVYADVNDILLSVGVTTPADASSFLIPSGASLELKPVPIGLVAAKSLVADQTLYVLSS